MVAALHAVDHLFVLAEIAQQIGAAKLVIERRAAQGSLSHDGQSTGHVSGLPQTAAPQFGDAETGQASFGFGATPCCAFVADFAPCTCCRTWKGRDGGGVVVGFHLHQNMLDTLRFVVAWHKARQGCCKFFNRVALHDGRVVRIGHHRVLRRGGMGVANHAKQAVALRLAINTERGVENFMATVLAVGLCKHHQLGVAGVAPQFGKGF